MPLHHLQNHHRRLLKGSLVVIALALVFLFSVSQQQSCMSSTAATMVAKHKTQEKMTAKAEGVDGNASAVNVSSPHQQQPPQQQQQHSVAIALISMGQNTKLFQVERCLESIRKNGQFEGPVLVMTDNSTRYTSLEGEDSKFFVYNPSPEMYKMKLKVFIPYKRFKTFAIEALDSFPQLNGVQTIVYLDMDVVIGKPLAPLFAYTRTILDYEIDHLQETNPQFGSVMVGFDQTRCGTQSFEEPVHTGVSFLDRRYSLGCLLTWRHMMEIRGKFEKRDQKILGIMMAKSDKNNCTVSTIDKKGLLSFPTEESMQRGEVQTPLIHITNSGRVKRIARETQRAYLEETLNLTNAAIPPWKKGRRR